MDLELGGHTVLVTGAASGIGLATAEAFAREGCGLLLWDVAPTVADVAVKLARQHAIEAVAHVVDIANFDETTRKFSEFVSSGKRIDHVVHCAAIGSGKFGFPFTKLTPSDWKRTLEINILGMVNIAHVTTDHLLQRGAGSFVFLASIAGQIGSQTDPPYSASKAANINFAQCMAKDLAPHGVRVNTVCPGMVQTPLNRSVWQAWHDNTVESERLSYEDWTSKKIKSMVPLGRWQSSQDIADMIVFLSSARAGQVTGQSINVDGGFVMHW